MLSDAKATVVAAVVTGLLGIAAGVGGTLFTAVTKDPGADHFAVQKAGVIKELSYHFTHFVGARHDLMRHLQAEPVEDAKSEKVQNFVKKAQSLRAIAVVKFREMRSSLLLASKVYGGEIEELISAFLDWHREEELKRVSLHVSEWVPSTEYEQWSLKIIDALTAHYT